MQTITIRYESDMFGATLQALVDYAVAAGERVSVSATPGAAAAKPAAPPAKRHGRYGDGVAKGGGYGGRRDAEPPMDDDDDDGAEIICAYCWTNSHAPQYKRCFDCKEARDAELVDCKECDGANRHAPEYKRCYECAEAARADYVDCRECDGARRHAPEYKRCYECAQTRKAYAESADEAHAGAGYAG